MIDLIIEYFYANISLIIIDIFLYNYFIKFFRLIYYNLYWYFKIKKKNGKQKWGDLKFNIYGFWGKLNKWCYLINWFVKYRGCNFCLKIYKINYNIKVLITFLENV